MLHFYVCPKSVCCSCVCRGLEARLHSLPFIFDFLWRELFFDFSFFDGLLPLGAGPCLIVGFYFFSPFFCSFLQSCCHFSLGLLLVLFSMTQYGHWAFYYITCRLLCPICFFLGILGPFTFLGLLWHFS